MSVQNAEIPVDQTHTAHNYFAHGGNELVIGGKLTFLSGATVEGGDGLFEGETLYMDQFNFVGQSDPLANPSKTSIDGVFVAGTATGPMDIPDSILSAGSASSEAISYLIQH